MASRLARATILMLVSIGAVMSIDAASLAAGGDLFHVHAGARVEHRAPLGDGDDRERIGLAARDQAGAVDRVDGDIDHRRVARAQALAVIKHRRLVLLSLADHDDAIHVHDVEQKPHGVDGRLVGGVLVTPSHPPRGRQGGGLGGADQVEGQVGIGRGDQRPAGLWVGPLMQTSAERRRADGVDSCDGIGIMVSSEVREFATAGTRRASLPTRGKESPSAARSRCRRRPPRR